MTRTFGIELLENILSTFYSVFFKVSISRFKKKYSLIWNELITVNILFIDLLIQHPEFSSLLKEKVCALTIKLFSPNVKCQPRIGQQQQQPSTTLDKPFFPVSMRLLRLVSVLVQKYYSLLVNLLDF